MASPKHPQSITGLNISNRSVSNVKKARKQDTTHAVKRLHTPVMRATPDMVSTNANAVPANLAVNERKPTCRNL